MECEKKSEFTAYEYMSVRISKSFELVYDDIYKNFGWKRIAATYITNLPNAVNRKVTIQYKRNRNIPNKGRLIVMQIQCENILKRIDYSELKKEQKAIAEAVIIGILGLGAFAVAVFLYLQGEVRFALGAVFTGIVICFFPYFVYKDKKNNDNLLNVNEKYEKLWQICEQANELLNRTEIINQ